jgi:hypothetical protein
MKDTVQRALELDILHLQRNGFLSLAADVSWQIEWTLNGEPCSSIGYVLAKHGALPVSMRLRYATANSTTNGDSRACDYWVSITTTACKYGGVRLWFMCPAWKNGIACRRRCRKLYLSPRGHAFACRVCHDLTYESTQRSGSLFYQLIGRPMKIRDKALAALKRSRASRRQEWLLQKMEWAERVLQLGFVRLPGAAEILGPILASEWRMWHYRDRRGGL